MRMLAMIGVAALTAACGGEGGEQKKAPEAKAAALQPGEYEVTGTVDSLRSTDQTTPDTRLKPGAALTAVRACIAADGKLDPKLIAESAGDTCKEDTAFIRSGRINVQLNCQRSGKGGIMQLANGTFKADSFEVEVLSNSFFSGSGDYSMTRKLTGKRVRDCTKQG
jgi:hypothetical protein